MEHDIIIVGAGPAGLCFARSLADSGLNIALIEGQPEAAIAEPAFDGREIALTHRSRALLEALGIWERLPPEEISQLRDAQVLNGNSRRGLFIDHRDGGRDTLGFLVPNHAIRAAAYEVVKASPALSLRTGTRVTGIDSNTERARLKLDDGSELQAKLIVAADSRFSETRRAMGIAASMHDFGRTMLVCRMTHEIGHEHVALEWFGHGQTLALLPLNGNQASAVLTLPNREIAPLLDMDDTEFGIEMTRRFDHRLGAMQVASSRHPYPLVGVYPSRFVARRFAAVGDAAVGMHPVTAHGFNFGLSGQALLADALRAAMASGADIGAETVLARYERAHRRATRPLYLATQLIARLYTDEAAPARLLREAVLRVGNRLAPLRRAIAGSLTGHA